MRFAGMQKLTLLDVPGHTACTLFTAGCNLRCPFCHNSILVPADTDQPLDDADVLDFLTKRRGLLDGVCITGGEPLIHPELETFLEKVRALSSYYIKLDTNGTFPRQLRHLIDRNLLDMVAMDIKNTPEKYAMTCGLPDMRLDSVKESIELLRDAPIEVEFRTTVMREMHTEEDLRRICAWTGGRRNYFLQPFLSSPQVPDSSLSAYPAQEMEGLVQGLKQDYPWVHLRGGD